MHPWTEKSKVHKHQRNHGLHLLCIRTADFILLYRRSLSTPGVFSYLRLSFKAFDILQKRKWSSKTDENTFYFTKKGCKHVGLTMWFGYPVIVRRYTFVIRLWSLVDNVIWSDRSLDNVLVIYCDPIVRSCTKNCAYELFLRNIKSLQIIEIFPIIFRDNSLLSKFICINFNVWDWISWRM